MTDDRSAGPRLVVIARFRDESHAHLAAARLDAEGVDAAVTDVMPGRALGVRRATVAVPPADAKRAAAVSGETPGRGSLPDGYHETPSA